MLIKQQLIDIYTIVEKRNVRKSIVFFSLHVRSAGKIDQSPNLKKLGRGGSNMAGFN